MNDDRERRIASVQNELHNLENLALIAETYAEGTPTESALRAIRLKLSEQSAALDSVVAPRY
jgi:hypothetical protein